MHIQIALLFEPVGRLIPCVWMEVLATATIANVKTNFEEISGIPPRQQHLTDWMYGELEDGRTLLDYGIGDGDNLQFRHSRAITAYLHLYGRAPDCVLQCFASDTIDNVRAKIETAFGLPCACQAIELIDPFGISVHPGNAEGGRTLGDYLVYDYVKNNVRAWMPRVPNDSPPFMSEP